MSMQFLLDGVLQGALIALGAIGITLTYAILRFSNFAHGDLMAWGAYAAMVLAAAIGQLVGGPLPIGGLSFGLPLLAAMAGAMVLTVLLAWALDRWLYAPIAARSGGGGIVVVMASFGASLALRSLLEFAATSAPRYYSRAIQIAQPLPGGVRATPDQLAMLALTAALVAGTHLFLQRSQLGREMRAFSQNPQLARIVGIDERAMRRATWAIGAALACAAGVMLGVLVQLRPLMGLELLLPMFAAAILGGIGSVPGAALAGLLIGVSEAAAVLLIGAEWRAAVSFVILMAVLAVLPQGLFGRAAR